MKYIFNPFTPIPANPKSHVRGWSLYWERMLDAQILSKDLSFINSQDTIYLEHGVNFNGALNLFGGLTDDVAERLEVLLKIRPKLYSLDFEMPDYHQMVSKRVGQSTCSKLITPKFLEELKEYFGTAENINSLTLQKPWLCIGDSHSTSFAKHGSAVSRTNGKTLHGFLNSPWAPTQKPYENLQGITLVHGSIDVRHHLARLRDPVEEGVNLINRLVLHAKKLEDALGIIVELAGPVPVEYEGRKLPKTGFYKNTPFFGSLEARQNITTAMIDCLQQKHASVVIPPNKWYNMDPEAYANEVMELGGSVHISPTHYRSSIPWGI